MIKYLIELWQAYKEDRKRIQAMKELQEHNRLEYLKNRAEWFDSLPPDSYVQMTGRAMRNKIKYDNMMARNDPEALHVKAKSLGIKAMNLGCSCEDCNKQFDYIINSSKDPTVISNLDFSKGYDQPAYCGQIDFEVNNSYARAIWNKAIEEAAKEMEEYGHDWAGEAIRKLKK